MDWTKPELVPDAQKALEKVPNFKLGGDPELILFKKNGENMEATLPEDVHWKAGTIFAGGYYNTGEVARDGRCLEIRPPSSSCREVLYNNFWTSFTAAKGNGALLDHVLSFLPVAEFDPKGLDEESKRIGCNPDYCAYNSAFTNPRDFDFSQVPYLIAGGHIHYGISNVGKWMNNPEEIKEIVKVLDYTAGMMSVILAAKPDREAIRRRFFGKAGTFRVKPYGIEYRTPSNDVWSSAAKLSLTCGAGKLGISALFLGGKIGKKKSLLWKMASETEVRRIIDECDVAAAMKLWPYLRDWMLLIGSYLNYCIQPFTNRHYIQGVESWKVLVDYIENGRTRKDVDGLAFDRTGNGLLSAMCNAYSFPAITKRYQGV